MAMAVAGEMTVFGVLSTVTTALALPVQPETVLLNK
jgi:hypothetical protein